MKTTLSFLTTLAIIFSLFINIVFAEKLSLTEITKNGNTVTVTNAPENSTLITAFYKDKILSDVKLYKGSGTITADIKNSNINFDTIKIFLWDMETLKPLTSNTLEVNMNNETSNNNQFGFNYETKTVKLNDGRDMPIIGLGTYSLHGDTCVNAVFSALQNGYRLIDTASYYGNQEEVGEGIRKAIKELGIKREEIFVTTKLYPGSEMANPEQAIESCLSKLNIDYIDMMLLHHPDTNDVKAYKAMEKYVEKGKIRSIGVSNYYISEMTDFIAKVDTPPAIVQNEIHPYYQESEVIDFIHNSTDTVVQGWYPFGGRGYTKEILGNETLIQIGKAHNKTAAQVILRWNLQKGVAVIPGSSNPDHIKENMDIFDFELTDKEMKTINSLNRNEKHDWY